MRLFSCTLRSRIPGAGREIRPAAPEGRRPSPLCRWRFDLYVGSMIDARQAESWLTGSVAVIGASDSDGNFGRTVYRALLDHGIAAVAVHPDATSVAGDMCYSSVTAVPDPIDCAIVMVPAAQAAQVVRACVDHGIARIWLFKGAGRGSVSDEAVRLCDAEGVEVITGACPLMFLQPVGGVHRLHRIVRRMAGSLTGA